MIIAPSGSIIAALWGGRGIFEKFQPPNLRPQRGVDLGDDVVGEIERVADQDERFAQGFDLPGFGFGIMLLATSPRLAVC